MNTPYKYVHKLNLQRLLIYNTNAHTYIHPLTSQFKQKLLVFNNPMPISSTENSLLVNLSIADFVMGSGKIQNGGWNTCEEREN